MAAPMAMPGSAQQQQQISPSMPISHAGLGFSPSIHQGPSSQMFFNTMPLHTPPAASSLVASPFQQQMPSSSWSPSKPRLTGAATGIGVGGDMILPSASLGSVPAQLRQAHMFQSSAQQQYPHQ
ncbi:hypothetical protein LPJ56_006151 [Coemansia sp. RSA 2599]|nr:hypothetical protein LPJ56_006151 [Coemansia sp. RSA 2599]